MKRITLTLMIAVMAIATTSTNAMAQKAKPAAKAKTTKSEAVKEAPTTLESILARFEAATSLQSTIDATKTFKLEVDIAMPQMSIGSTLYQDAANKKTRAEIKMGVIDMLVVVDGDKGWMKSPQGTQEVPTAQLDQFTSNALSTFDAKSYSSAKLLDEALMQDGVSYNIVEAIDKKGDTNKLFFSQADGLLYMIHGTMQGQAVVIKFSEYKKFDGGFTMPVKTVVEVSGQSITTTIKTIEIDFPVAAWMFTKPE